MMATTTNKMNNVIKKKPILRGVCFDMDGTLTIPNLDFGEMYRRCGVDSSKDILEEIAAMPESEQKVAYNIMDEIEEEGRRTLELMPGASELTSWLSAHNIPMALVTRNTRKSADVLTKKLLPSSIKFDPVIPRDADYPAKPNPDALHAIAIEWSLELPSDGIVMVGDSVSNDIVFGKNAGVSTALLDTDGSKGSYEPKADFIMAELTALSRHLWSNFCIESPLATSVKDLHSQPYPEPTTDLTKAAAEGDLQRVRGLASREEDNFDINAMDESGNTALIWAAENNHLEFVKWILNEFSNDIDLDHMGYLGSSAVLRASRRGYYEVLHALIQAGANLDLPNHKLQHPLHFAAFQEHKDIVKLLLKYGANPRNLDRKGRTPAYDTKSESIRDIMMLAMRPFFASIRPSRIFDA
jgi:HAD superfamily hydrolase (TIGR01549 family)